MHKTIKEENLNDKLANAISFYWKTRQKQSQQQVKANRTDQGTRSAVTGGAQMDGFINLVTQLIINEGVDKSNIYYDRSLELPGYFRPTKKWDLLVVKDRQLILALETKSQVGPSFGNNFNNRIEEALGSAMDLWTAYREGAFNKSIKPWLGYLFLLEDCRKSKIPVAVQEPHFQVFPEFKDASYAKRYEVFCRKLVRECHYNIASFILSDEKDGLKGIYSEPADDLTFSIFVRSLTAQIAAFGTSKS